jgi:hypothetical protein
MYLVMRNQGSRREYFGYNEKGEGRWFRSRLSAAHFNNFREAVECGVEGDAINVGRDGEVRTYKGVEIQIYQKKGKWRFRIGVFDSVLEEYHFCHGRKCCSTPSRALAYGRRFVDSMTVSPTGSRLVY